jgi:hypothetical protein
VKTILGLALSVCLIGCGGDDGGSRDGGLDGGADRPAACNIFAACPGGQSCDFLTSCEVACYAPGPGQRGQACSHTDTNTGCAPTLTCVLVGSGGMVCAKWCRGAGDCQAGEDCRQVSVGTRLCREEMKVCVPRS